MPAETHHVLDETAGKIYPIQLVPVGKRQDVPAPLVRVSTCGGLQLEVLQEVIHTDHPQGRYQVVTLQNRPKGSSTGLTLLKILASLPEHYASKDWLTERLPRTRSTADEQDEDEWGQQGLIRIDNVVSLLRNLLCPSGIDGEEGLRKILVSYVRNHRDSGPGYRLAADPLVWLDVDVIATSVKQALLLEQEGSEAVSAWEQVYTLASRGSYLPDEAYSDWAKDTRLRVEGYARQAVHALHRLYLAHKGEAGEEQAIVLLRSYWQTHTTDEEIFRPLLELFGKRGHLHEADEYYQHLCQQLELEGRTPSSRTRRTIQNVHSESQYKYDLLQSRETGSSLHASSASHFYQLDETLAPFSHAITEMVSELEGVIHLDTSRRRLLQQILPVLFGVSSSTLSAPVMDVLSSLIDGGVSFYSTAIPACWSLVYNGGIEHVEKVLPAYLAHLSTLTQHSSQDRKLAAHLASQGYKLANLLDLRREDFGTALQHSKEAFLHGRIAEDPNLQVAALIEEALTFWYHKRLPQTLATCQKALQFIEGGKDISPIIKGRFYIGLAVIYAEFEQEQEALRYRGLAYDTFPEHPENDPHFSYTHYNHYYLYLGEGIMYTRLNQPENALASYTHIHGTEYMPRHAEIANREAAALLTLGDLDRCSSKIEKAVALALSIKSNLRYSEAYEIYQEMHMKWPREKKVKDLIQVFQQ